MSTHHYSTAQRAVITSTCQMCDFGYPTASYWFVKCGDGYVRVKVGSALDAAITSAVKEAGGTHRSHL